MTTQLAALFALAAATTLFGIGYLAFALRNAIVVDDLRQSVSERLAHREEDG